MTHNQTKGCCPEKDCAVGSWDTESCGSCDTRCSLKCDHYRGAFANHVRIHPPTHPVQRGDVPAGVRNCARGVYVLKYERDFQEGCQFLRYVLDQRRCTHPYQGPTTSQPGRITCPFVKVLEDTQ